jgi:DNA-binding PadR family transcriptional regulator
MYDTELTILVALSHGEMYGREILNKTIELTGRRGRLAVGGLYTTLHRMEKKGLVVGRWGDDGETSDGARRRYYLLTADGAKTISHAKSLMLAAAQRPVIGDA